MLTNRIWSEEARYLFDKILKEAAFRGILQYTDDDALLKISMRHERNPVTLEYYLRIDFLMFAPILFPSAFFVTEFSYDEIQEILKEIIIELAFEYKSRKDLNHTEISTMCIYLHKEDKVPASIYSLKLIH